MPVKLFKGWGCVLNVKGVFMPEQVVDQLPGGDHRYEAYQQDK
jgi:hypothetical protein